MNKRYRWDCIFDRIKHMAEPVGAEIGVHRGENSGHLLELHPDLRLYMIDMWSHDTYDGKGDDAATEPYRRLYQDECIGNMSKALKAVHENADRAIVRKMSSVDAAKRMEDHVLDFVFIDASHSYDDVLADIKAWAPKVKPGGWIMGHDYDNPNFTGTTKAVNNVFYGSFVEADEDYFWGVRL